MTTVRVDFLGCKVSHADAHEAREALQSGDDGVLRAMRRRYTADRPGRGYGNDDSPWLVDAPVGALARVRATTVAERGIRGEAA